MDADGPVEIDVSRNPTAFLCHADVDSPLAARVATDLRSRGVDVWYSGWDLQPGDSLRRTLEQGIEGAAHFLVLVTGAIAAARWAQVELDAAFAKYAERSCRIIPIVAGLAPDQVPLFLRAIFWVSLEPYDEGVRKIVAACYGVSSKPPLGSSPSWAIAAPLPDHQLSPNAQRLAVILNERSEHGIPVASYVAADILSGALEMSPDDLAVAADELRSLGWVMPSRERPAGPAGFARLRPELTLFFETDRALKGWDPTRDAHSLAAALVNANTPTVLLTDLDARLTWGPRRLNIAAEALVALGGVHPLPAMGTHPYAYHALHATTATRRLAVQPVDGQ